MSDSLVPLGLEAFGCFQVGERGGGSSHWKSRDLRFTEEVHKARFPVDKGVPRRHKDPRASFHLCARRTCHTSTQFALHRINRVVLRCPPTFARHALRIFSLSDVSRVVRARSTEPDSLLSNLPILPTVPGTRTDSRDLVSLLMQFAPR